MSKSKKELTETQKEMLQAFEAIANALDKRADDTTTISHWSGPKSDKAVRMALRHVADVISGKNALKQKPRAVLKRVPDTAPKVPVEHPQLEDE